MLITPVEKKKEAIFIPWTHTHLYTPKNINIYPAFLYLYFYSYANLAGAYKNYDFQNNAN